MYTFSLSLFLSNNLSNYLLLMAHPSLPFNFEYFYLVFCLFLLDMLKNIKHSLEERNNYNAIENLPAVTTLNLVGSDKHTYWMYKCKCTDPISCTTKLKFAFVVVAEAA